MLKTKSIGTKIEKSDGLRILVSRFRGHGVSTSRYDVWMANLGPSEKLLRSFLKDKSHWDKFSRAYRMELFDSGSADRKNKTIKNLGQKFTLRLLQKLANQQMVTLLCHCPEEEKHCHRHVLLKVLEGKV